MNEIYKSLEKNFAQGRFGHRTHSGLGGAFRFSSGLSYGLEYSVPSVNGGPHETSSTDTEYPAQSDAVMNVRATLYYLNLTLRDTTKLVTSET